MFAVGLLFLYFLAPPIPTATAIEPSDFLKACSLQEAAIIKYFESDQIWRPDRKGELLEQLRIVGILRPKVLIPILIHHIHYYDDAHKRNMKAPTPEEEYPVYGALKQYGNTAYPDLFVFLRRSDAVEKGRTADI